MGSTRNREDRNDGHDRHGELDLGCEFVRSGPRARPSSPASYSSQTTSCRPGLAMVGGFPTVIPIDYGWVDYGDSCRWAPTARPSITSRATSPFLRNRCLHRPITTPSRRVASGIFPTSEQGETIRWAARRWHRRTCRFLPTRTNPNTSRGPGPSLERQGRSGAASFRRLGFDSLIEIAATGSDRRPCELSRRAIHGAGAVGLALTRTSQLFRFLSKLTRSFSMEDEARPGSSRLGP